MKVVEFVVEISRKQSPAMQVTTIGHVIGLCNPSAWPARPREEGLAWMLVTIDGPRLKRRSVQIGNTEVTEGGCHPRRPKTWGLGDGGRTKSENHEAPPTWLCVMVQRYGDTFQISNFNLELIDDRVDFLLRPGLFRLS